MFFQALLAVLLQLHLAAAAPITTQGNEVGFGAGGGVIGFVVLVLDIICVVEVLQSSRPVPNKVLWCLLVFLFPIVGMLIYYFFSNRKEHSRSGGYEAIGGN